jgi:hypothetical protein
MDDIDESSEPLLKCIKALLPELESLLEKVNGHWRFEDGFYRFYHQSWKVYSLQASTQEIVVLLRSLKPDTEMNASFLQIVREGTGLEFSSGSDWLAETRPILEAFFHARTMLELSVRYGRELEHAPRMMPSGWATLLYLFNAR